MLIKKHFKGKGAIEMKTLTRDEIQMIRMCIKTYINMNGVTPDKAELVEWLGSSYEPLLALYDNNTAA